MKLFEKWAWGCLSAFLFFSCGGKQEVEHTGAAEQKIVVDLSKAGKSYDLKNELDPSGVVIVPLETHRECLIGRIERIFVRKDRIFIYDSQSKSVYFFDMEGRCTGKLHAYGVGPEEYASMTDAFVDEENIYVADSYRKQVQVYDLSGEYVKTIKTPDWSFYGIFTTESRIYYVNMGATHPVAGNYLLFSTDKDGGGFSKIPSVRSFDTVLPFVSSAVRLCLGWQNGFFERQCKRRIVHGGRFRHFPSIPVGFLREKIAGGIL